MRNEDKWLLALLLLYAFLVYFFLVGRYDRTFVESDSSNQTRIIFAATETNDLTNSSRVYSNGYAYTAVSVFLLRLTGLSVYDLQLVVYPLLSTLLVIVVFTTYQLLVSNTKVALLATFLIYLQPDFLFVTWRASHERITWLFSLLLLSMFVKSLMHADRLSLVVRYMLLFYLLAFALVTTNTLFASSYTAGLILSFAGGYGLMKLRERYHLASDLALKRQMQRLLYTAASFGILLYLFIFYIYPPARQSIGAFGGWLDSLVALLLNNGHDEFNPYARYISFDFTVYLILTAFTWLMLAISSLGWLKYAVDFLRAKEIKRETLPILVLWLTYAAYATQLAAAIFADRSGGLSGNLQVRIFTPFTLLMMPMAALAIWKFVNRLKQPHWRRAFALLSAIAVIVFSATSLLKAGVDPLVGNKWIFNTIPEQTADRWLINHVPLGSRIWAGYDERLTVGLYFYELGTTNREVAISYANQPRETDQYFYFSSIEQARWLRQGRPLPNFEVKNLIYDNGTAAIYRSQPQTPFQ